MSPSSDPIEYPAVKKAEDLIITGLRAAKGLSEKTPRVGLAISGGGIRSATFSLGILQALHQMKLLNSMQLLSTVSGGGYIGSWLVSAFRNGPKEDALEAQSPAIHHLRQYSRYLSPQTGALSADAWTILANWLRNAGLIQVSVVLALAAVLLLPRFAVWTYDLVPGLSPSVSPWQGIASGAWFLPGLLSFVFLLIAVFSIRREITRLDPGWQGSHDELDQGNIIWRIAFPVLLSAGFAAVGLWPVIQAKRPLLTMLVSAQDKPTAFQGIGLDEWLFHLIPVITLGAIACYVAWIARRSHDRTTSGIGVVLLATSIASLDAGLSFMLLGYVAVEVDVIKQVEPGAWWKMVGPSLMLVTFGQCLTLVVGILGRDMPDRQREWWNRLSAWILIFAAGTLVICMISIQGPFWLASGWDHAHSLLKPAAILGWIGSTFAGVMAGKSEKTSDRKSWLDWVAIFGPYAFILGLVLISAMLLEMALSAVQELPHLKDLAAAAIVLGVLGLIALLRGMSIA